MKSAIYGAFFVCALAGAVPAQAQSSDFPDYFFDAIAQIGLATTAALECDGSKSNDKNINKAAKDVMVKLAGDGFDPTAAVGHLSTEAGVASILLRETALRERHSVDAIGISGLCAAIRAELVDNQGLAKLVKMK
jgi:hypothetical protein